MGKSSEYELYIFDSCHIAKNQTYHFLINTKLQTVKIYKEYETTKIRLSRFLTTKKVVELQYTVSIPVFLDFPIFYVDFKNDTATLAHVIYDRKKKFKIGNLGINDKSMVQHKFVFSVKQLFPELEKKYITKLKDSTTTIKRSSTSKLKYISY